MSGECLSSLEGHGYVESAVFSPDGELVVTASGQGSADVWSSVSAEWLRSLEGHRGGVRSVVFSWDGKLVLAASGRGIAMLWSSASGLGGYV